MLLKFIGKDKSMGLKHGHKYYCHVETIGDRIFVIWGGRVTGSCPYDSIKALAANWETDI